MTQELLPCPFSGKPPRGPIKQGNGSWTIWAAGYHRNAPTERDVIRAWNTRSAADLQARLDAAEGRTAELVALLEAETEACAKIADASRTKIIGIPSACVDDTTMWIGRDIRARIAARAEGVSDAGGV